MTDYIKREDAVKALLDEFDGDIRYTMTIDEFVSNTTRIINSVPTVDAVEVVRCKECEHSYKAMYYAENCLACRFDGGKVHKDNYFCADGARKKR